jgi:putative thioredoxin
MTASPNVRNVTAATFQADVVDSSQDRPVVIDFWAPWCGPCRALAPVLEKLVEERQGKVLLAKVNTDEEQELATYFRIEALPTIRVIFKGKVVHGFEGALPEEALRQFLDEIAPSSDSALEKAHAAEQRTPQQAEEQYRKILAEQPNNDEARLGLARVLLAENRTGEIAAVLEPVSAEGEAGIEADRIKAQVYLLEAARGLPDEATLRQRIADATLRAPEKAQAHLDLGCVLAAKGDYEKALEMLLAAAELDMKLASGRAREVMVKVFYALGSNHPLANDYRARLARLLY